MRFHPAAIPSHLEEKVRSEDPNRPPHPPGVPFVPSPLPIPDYLGELAMNLAYSTGCELVGLNIKKRGVGWLAVIKVVRARKKLVSFVGGDSFRETVTEVSERTRSGELSFMADRYPNSSP